MIPLLPDQFWALTPFEAACLVNGGNHRHNDEWERAAFLAAQIINISGKSLREPITPDQLLGRKRPVQVIDPGAKEAELMRRLDALGLAKE